MGENWKAPLIDGCNRIEQEENILHAVRENEHEKNDLCNARCAFRSQAVKQAEESCDNTQQVHRLFHDIYFQLWKMHLAGTTHTRNNEIKHAKRIFRFSKCHTCLSPDPLFTRPNARSLRDSGCRNWI